MTVRVQVRVNMPVSGTLGAALFQPKIDIYEADHWQIGHSGELCITVGDKLTIIPDGEWLRMETEAVTA